MPLVGKLKVNSVAKHSGNFQQNVIKVIRKIPYGRVTTYGTIAVMAGLPRGARLVGGILHYNSDKYSLPWQRVINRHGYISTRCEGHTKMDQKELLEQEGIEVSSDFMIDLDQYGWFGQ
jgi:methylated-DNA-protein-cysteine methyltransferase related protein